MRHSDIIVPKGAENKIAIEFITENLKNRLRDRGILMNIKSEKSHKAVKV